MKYPASTILKARELRASGVGPAEIARQLNVPKGTVEGWLYELRRTEPRADLHRERREKKKGSGVVAGPAYARGYRVGWGRW